MSAHNFEDALLAAGELPDADVNMIDEGALLGPIDNNATAPEPVETIEVETSAAATEEDHTTPIATTDSVAVSTVATQSGELTCSNCQDLIREIRDYRDETRIQLRGLHNTMIAHNNSLLRLHQSITEERRSRWQQQSPAPSRRPSPVPSQRPSPTPSRRQSRSRSPIATGPQPREPCAFCGEMHWSDSCRRYVTPASRSARLQENRRCILCLRDNHVTEACRAVQPCHHCKELTHHRSLCASNNRIRMNRY